MTLTHSRPEPGSAPVPGCMHALLETWAARHPDETALHDGHGRVSYGELNRRAGALAARLRARGAGLEERVGVALERSPALVAAVLGVMRAGAAFVPLDPALPRERRAYMAADAGVRRVITSPALRVEVPDGVEVLLLDHDGNAAGEDAPAAADAAGGAFVPVPPEALAYVIYTSGSTGRPKGVAVTHGGVCSTARAQAALFQVRPGDRVLQFASPSFDASVSEIFVTLLAGAELHLADREALLPGPALAALLQARRITHATLPPSALALLPDAPLPELRTLVVAGEACPGPLALRWGAGRRLVNAYGPTEVAICATAAVCRPDGSPPPIGTAIDGARAYVPDAAGAGAEGELFVGGAGVARGYLGRPGLTAERFLPDPWAETPGARMYRTGDRVRREEGAAGLRFVGRMDEQVKVRGQRVEPGEVAAALAAHPAVAQSLVLARPAEAGGARLVAYYVPRAASAALPVDEMRAFLARSLPEYMLPAAFVAMDAFPLNSSGKVDRAALPAPAAGRPALARPYAAPATPLERRVAEVWQEVLGIAGIGADDGFHELGGHSLAAAQAAARLREDPGVEAPLAVLLGGGTVAQLARALADAPAAPGAGEVPPLVPVPRGGDLPLSYSQERVWFMSQLAPDSRAYHAHAALTFHGALDVPALEWALSEMVRRHEVLRTTYPTVDGRAVQRIHPAWQVRLPVHDLSGAPEAERGAALQAWTAGSLAEGFRLDRLPLARWSLARLGPDEHVLLHSEHHIIHDGWSFNVLLRELLEAYRARVEGRAPALPPLPVQFADVCVWQRRWMQTAEARAHLEFWRRRLAGSPPALELPLDRPRPAVPRFHGAAPRFELSPALYRGVRALAHAEGASLFMAMLAAFKALMSRWSGQEDVSVGTGIAARGRREVEGVVGMFVNSLVLRTDLSGPPTFRELLRRVRETALEAYAHQEVPLDAVLDAVRPDRTLSHNPLFQVMFSFHDSVQPELSLPGVRTELRVALSNGSAKLDLNVVAIPHAEQRALRAEDGTGEGAEGITLVWEHDSDLFDLATIHRMFAHYRALLEAAVADPDRPVTALPMLAPEEREARLDAGRAVAAFPVRRCLHQRFAEAAAARPGAVAVRCEGSSWTYAELDARANRLARHLRARGVAPGARVAVCLERSPELVCTLLAVLKAGAAYVPLAPEYPAERLAFVLRDAGAAVLVTRGGAARALPAHGAAVVDLAEEAEAVAGRSADDPAVPLSPEHPAYVIYTSGSTGRPKGVEVPHAAAMRLFHATDAWFGFGPDDVWTLFHSCAFDFSVWEMWGALLHGGRLVVVPLATARAPAELRRLLVEEGVTVLNQTPSAFRELVRADAEAGGDPRALRLRWVVFGGEALNPAWLEPWFRRHGAGGPRLANMYGITETTVHVTWREITRADAERGGSPIGVPIPDLSLYLLDRHGEPVPVGVAGEIFVGGAGVARGYLGRPGLTAERFVPDPFGGEPGARLYRSGDLARRLGDGELEYQGRADQQVKVRGFRIEPGEVEAALCGHPAVARAAVLAREDAPGDRRLAAYLVPRDGERIPSAEALRAFAGRVLPEYMVPAVFVEVDHVPLTPNGKLDAAALAARGGGVETGQAYAAPRTPAEQVLAEVWREVLQVDRVGIDDNYFALGGDSIRSVRVAARARERGVPVTLTQLFRHQTVRSLAAAAREAPAEGEAEGTAPFSLVDEGVRRALPAEVEDAYPLTRLQLAMLYHSERDPGSERYHNVNSYLLRTGWDEDALREAVRGLARRHPVLRTSFDLAGFAEPLQRVHAGAEVPLAVFDLRGEAPEAQRAALDAFVAAERARPFDWTRPPLVRFAAHRLADDAFRFSVTEHHAALDGWSVAAMLTELFRGYAALRAGAPDPAAPPASAFRDFVALELRARAAPETRAFWSEVLRGARTTPAPRDGGSAGAAEPGERGVELDEAASAALRRAADHVGVPLKSVLLAAHLHVLARAAGTREVLTGVVASGRPEAADGDRILGLFLNTVPLRVAADAPTWAELARAAFAAEREMLPHRRFPLADAQRLAGRAPLLETAFNYIHFHVYHDLLRTDGVEFQGAGFFQRTEIPLVANFYTDVHTGRVRFRLDHDPAVLSAAGGAALAEAYRGALAALAADPDAPLPPAPAAASARAAVTAVPAAPVHVLFAEAAAARPAAVAVSAGGARVTYAELDARANRLARQLAAAGVRAETRVGVALERSPALPEALLAVLKAGAAYVPLDPGYPAERLAWMVEDAGVRVLLVDDVLPAPLASFAGPVVSLARDAAAIAAREAAPPAAIADPESLAYVMYTSGSTGRPKGVAVPHRAVVRLVRGADYCRLGPDEVLLQLAPAAFDASTWEIWGALLNGGRLAVAPPGAPSAEGLRAVVGAEGVTALWLTAGLFHQVADADPRALRGVRQLLAGGDVLSPARARAVLEANPGLVVINGYGPTENTTFTACHPMRAPGEVDDPVPLGVPVSGTSVMVLDDGLRPVATGEAGELYAGGAGVARGYLGRPGLTAERFVPDPVSGVPGARLYRTGDRARWSARGEVEFLGRADRQLKLRGFRVEPGEVEAVLAAHPGVRDVAVAAPDGPGGQPRLTAWYVSGEADPGAEALAAFAARRLPPFMVPAAFVSLPAFPLGATGKVDLAALAGGPASAPETDRPPYRAPATPAEAALCAACAEALGMERVGVDDDFLALGGDSLAAVRVVARARAGAPGLTIAALLAHPTLGATAASLSPAPATAGASAAVDTAAEADGLLGRLEALSDEEVERLLEEMEA